MGTLELDEKLKGAIQESLDEGRLSCANAFKIARDLKVPIRRVGDACNQLQIKINRCQLGCFK